MSSRYSVAAKMRIIHSVIRLVLEYGMERWGPPEGSAPRKCKRGDSRPGPPLQLFDNLLLSAFRLACGFADFVARLAELGVRVCPPQSFWLFVKYFPARVRATSLICDTLHVCRPHLSVQTPPATCVSVPLLMLCCSQTLAQAGPPYFSASA
jgi:hypothetical protein